MTTAVATKSVKDAPKKETIPTSSQVGSPTPTMVNLQQAIPTAKQVVVNLDDVWVDRGENIRQLESYDEDSIDQMAAQIEAVGGLIHPPTVVPIDPNDAATGNKKFSLLMGFRRWAGLQKLAESDPRWASGITVTVVDEADSKPARVMIQLLENIARKDINPVEKALSIKEALEPDHAGVKLRQVEVARLLGLSEPNVSQHLKMLTLPKEILDKVNTGMIPFSNVRTMLELVPADQYLQVAKLAESEDTATFKRSMERYAANLKGKQGDGGAGEGASTAGSKDSPQRPGKKVAKATDITSVYKPYLEKKLAEVSGQADAATPKYTEADLLKARLDTLNTVLLQNDTALAKDVAPFVQELQKKEADAKAHEESDKHENKFLRDCVKSAVALLEADALDISDPNRPRLTPSEAYAKVVRKVYKDKEAGAIDTEKEPLGFKLPEDMKDFLRKLAEKHQVVVKETAERQAAAKAAREKKQAEEKAAADEAAKNAPAAPAAEGATPAAAQATT